MIKWQKCNLSNSLINSLSQTQNPELCLCCYSSFVIFVGNMTGLWSPPTKLDANERKDKINESSAYKEQKSKYGFILIIKAARIIQLPANKQNQLRLTGHMSLWQPVTLLTHQNNKEQNKELLEMFLSVVLVEEHRANQRWHYWRNILKTFCQRYSGNSSIITGLTGLKFLKTDKQLKRMIILTKMSFTSSFNTSGGYRVWHKPRPLGVVRSEVTVSN